MSNFRFDYNDIHKQGTIADLSDEQIQELLNLNKNTSLLIPSRQGSVLSALEIYRPPKCWVKWSPDSDIKLVFCKIRNF